MLTTINMMPGHSPNPDDSRPNMELKNDNYLFAPEDLECLLGNSPAVKDVWKFKGHQDSLYAHCATDAQLVCLKGGGAVDLEYSDGDVVHQISINVPTTNTIGMRAICGEPGSDTDTWDGHFVKAGTKLRCVTTTGSQ